MTVNDDTMIRTKMCLVISAPRFEFKSSRVLIALMMETVRPSETQDYTTVQPRRQAVFTFKHLAIAFSSPRLPQLHLRSYLLTYSVALQPWRAQAAVNTVSVFEEQVANLLPQHRFESAWFNNKSHLVGKQENITGEKQSGNLADKASHSCSVGFFYMP
jgi:hypothetical protein